MKLKSIVQIASGFGIDTVNVIGVSGLTLLNGNLYIADTFNNAVKVIHDVKNQIHVPFTVDVVYQNDPTIGPLNGPQCLIKTPTNSLVVSNIDLSSVSAVPINSIVEINPITKSVIATKQLAMASEDPNFVFPTFPVPGSIGAIVAVDFFKSSGSAALIYADNSLNVLPYYTHLGGYNSTIQPPNYLK